MTWIVNTLSLSLETELLAECNNLRQWKKKLDVGGLSLVMPASSLESSLAAFSHTFLKIQSRHLSRQSTLHTAIGFSALFNPETPLFELAINGIFGGYVGRFGTPGYYEEVEHYGYAESREIFEYQLNLTEVEIDRLLNLIWEVQPYGIRYYFFTRNCSYYVLALLDAARPSLHLAERFQGFVLPQQTLLEVYWKTGLVSGMSFVPSKETKFRRLRENLNESEKVVYHKLVTEPQKFVATWEVESANFDSYAKARILEAFNQFLLQTNDAQTDSAQSDNSADNSTSTPKMNAVRSQVLMARSKLGVPPSLIELRPFDTPPHLGHGSYTIGTGVGIEDQEQYEMIRYRFTLHDFLNLAEGHNKNAEIEALNFELMVKKYEFELRQLKLFKVFSLRPIERDVNKASWLSQSLVERQRVGSNYHRLFLNDLGWGLSVGDQDWSVYGLLTLNSVLHPALERGYELGPGALLGARIFLGRSTTFLVNLWSKHFVLGQVESVLDSDVSLSHAFSREWEIRLTAKTRNRVADEQASLSYFF
jgi:hypothetical protein